MSFFQKFAVMNASGPLCTTLEELEKIATSESDYVVMKSATLEPREGNEEPRYYVFPGGSINSMGLPNLGYQKYIKFSHILAEKYSKPIIGSLIAMNPEDFPVMVEAFELHSACVAIEINLSCPNVIGKAQVGYDFDDTRDVLEKVCRYKNRLAFGVKLPPYFDFAYYEMMVKVLLDFPIDFITCINTVGNTLILDPIHHKPVLKPK